jgi:hypothetical protein
VVELAIFALGCRPAFPAEGLIEDESVFLAVQCGFIGAILLQAIKVFQKQKPGGLFGVIKFARAAGIFPKDIVDILESLLERRRRSFTNEVCLRLPVDIAGKPWVGM